MSRSISSNSRSLSSEQRPIIPTFAPIDVNRERELVKRYVASEKNDKIVFELKREVRKLKQENTLARLQVKHVQNLLAESTRSQPLETETPVRILRRNEVTFSDLNQQTFAKNTLTKLQFDSFLIYFREALETAHSSNQTEEIILGSQICPTPKSFEILKVDRSTQSIIENSISNKSQSPILKSLSSNLTTVSTQASVDMIDESVEVVLEEKLKLIDSKFMQTITEPLLISREAQFKVIDFSYLPLPRLVSPSKPTEIEPSISSYEEHSVYITVSSEKEESPKSNKSSEFAPPLDDIFNLGGIGVKRREVSLNISNPAPIKSSVSQIYKESISSEESESEEASSSSIDKNTSSLQNYIKKNMVLLKHNKELKMKLIEANDKLKSIQSQKGMTSGAMTTQIQEDSLSNSMISLIKPTHV